MKRFIASVLLTLTLPAAAIFADDDYVLEQARERARSDSRREAADEKSNRIPDLPYTPVVLAFTPGLSLPFGLYDSSVVLGAIGSQAGTVSGLQASGVFNLSRKVYGFQYAGVFNISGDVAFAQYAGVFNIAQYASGAQIAGVFNIARDVSGVQAAGVFNIAEASAGLQAAGLFNITGDFRGLLAAGLFNVAGTGKGAMIGVVNIADSLDGVAIGLVNIIRDGVHDTSVDWQWSTGTVYAGYRTGTPFLYASFYGGIPMDDLGNSGERLTFGAGLGHRQTAGPFALDFEFCAEAPFDPWAADPAGASFSDSASSVFGSLRATLGLGGNGGAGLYVGVKADFEDRGSGRVPAHLRSGEIRSLDAFGLSLDYWPKLFAGLRF